MGNLEAWAPTVVTLIAAIFTAGQVVGRIKDQEIAIAEHHAILTDHEKRINRSEAWRDGYKFAKRRSTDE
jgi:hypothetical protein